LIFLTYLQRKQTIPCNFARCFERMADNFSRRRIGVGEWNSSCLSADVWPRAAWVSCGCIW
jgi:hypothetical protein